jgi:phospholipid/cholesterol/gamma-HCH transport system substrate-binding protein
METKAHYALVGFFAISLIAAGALFAVWLGQLRFDQAYKEFDIVFEGPVRGLAVASEVRFNGIQVGEVTRLQLDRANPSMVVARIRIAEETPITRDSVAQLEPQGLTGLNYVQLNPGSPESDPLIARPGEIPRLSSRQAQLESLLASSEGIAQSAGEALARINLLLSEENLSELSGIVANINHLTDEVASDREDALIPMARRVLTTVDEASTKVSAFADTANVVMGEDVGDMVRETEQAAAAVNQAAASLEVILESARGPVGRFANEGLGDLTLAINDLRRVLADVEAIAAGVEDDPAAFVAGAQRQEVEIPR